jgi:hypothetical protein
MKVLLIFPLFYSSNSLNRLQSYLHESKSNYEMGVAVFCSNPVIEGESEKLARQFGFNFFPRNNFGGGEGAFFELFQSDLMKENYEVVIYLEESCEPMSSRWIESIVKPLEAGYNIYGWHWNWRARKRDKSIRVDFGSTFRPAVVYKNPERNHPLNQIISDNVCDVFGFRHECISIKLDQLPKNLLRINENNWKYVPTKYFGLSMERFFWDNLNPSVIKSPNFQFPMILKQNRMPLFTSNNFFRFRELSHRQKISSRYKPNHLVIRRLSLYYNMRILIFWSKNLVKFMVVQILRIDRPSKLYKEL